MTPSSWGYGAVDPRSSEAQQVGLARQVMAADLVVHDDGRARGTRCVLLQNDRIAIEVIVDRGMDIGRARIEQLPIAWASPTGIVAPGLLEQRGSEFLRGFHGGLLTTCGLDHIGHPTERAATRFNYEPRSVEQLPMHGRVSGIPATLTGYGVRASADGLEAFVEGVVSQIAIFGEHLTLTRRVSIRYGSAEIRIDDTVANNGYAPSPLAAMYHVNIGWPTFAPGALINIGGTPTSGDVVREVLPPTPDTAQSVTIYSITADRDGRGMAEIVNERLSGQVGGGARLSWDTRALPSLVRWQLANVAGHYVLGLEPNTGRPGPDGLSFPILAPGESRKLGLTIELLKFQREDRGG